MSEQRTLMKELSVALQHCVCSCLQLQIFETSETNADSGCARPNLGWNKLIPGVVWLKATGFFLLNASPQQAPVG